MLGGPVRQLELLLAYRAELGSVAERLLEVVAGDLRVLGGPARAASLEPVGEALVKLGTQLFGVAR